MLGVAGVALRTAGLAKASLELVSFWSFDETTATSGVFDDLGPAGVSMNLVGTWTDLTTEPLVQGGGGTSAYTDGSGYATIPANDTVHDLAALTISFYYQRVSAAAKQVLLAAGDGSQQGDFSVEVLADGKLRAWHTGQDAVLRFFESTDGVTGSDLGVGVAHRIDLTLGLQGARLYLDGAELVSAAIPANVNGWNPTRVKHLGRWTDGVQSPANGVFDRLRVWNWQLHNEEIALLEPAQSISLLPQTGLAVAPPSDIVPLGARHAAPGWGRPGFVVALAGRTSKPMDVLGDPRAVFSGPRSQVTFEFRATGGGAFPGGTWSSDGNGNLIFTSDGSSGVKSGEYRLRGNADNWSAWAPIRIDALSRPSGTLFDVENFSGSDTQKIQAAVDAANAAGGGVVYSSLGHAKQYIIAQQIRWKRPGIHLLDLNCKRISPTYNGGDPASSGSYSGLHGRNDRMFTTHLDKGPWSGVTTATHVVNCLFDGNGFDQPICTYSGAGGTPQGKPGNVASGGYGWPGEPPGRDGFNMQQQHIIACINSNGSLGPTMFIRGCLFQHSCGDGHTFNSRFTGTMEYNEYHANQRGGFVIVRDGGTYTMRRCIDDDVSQRADRPFLTPNSSWDTERFVAGGYDFEPENTSAPHAVTIEKSFIASDWDNLSQGGSDISLTDVISLRPMSPQIQWSRNIGDVSTYTRCTCTCHKEGANQGGTLTVNGTNASPRGRSTGGRQIYDDCDWYMGCDGPVWCQHGQRYQVLNNTECGWVIRLDGGATACQIEYRHNRFHRLVPAGRSLGTLYALWAISSLNGVNGLIILSGHISFDTGFARFPFRGNGGTIRILPSTTFAHADFPGETTFWSNFATVQDQR